MGADTSLDDHELPLESGQPGHDTAQVAGHRQLYCVGCCWVLMALLFVAGVMNLAWVALIAAFVLGEQVVPGGRRVGQVAGFALLAAGVVLIARAGG